MGLLETSLDGNQLLGESSGGIGRDFRTSQPLLVMARLDGLAGGDGVIREILCTRRKKKYVARSRLIGQVGRQKKEKDNSPSSMSSI